MLFKAKPSTLIFGGAVLIATALLSIRIISYEFRFGTTTDEHPYLLFVELLIAAGLVWMGLIPTIKRWVFTPKDQKPGSHRRWLALFFVLGIGMRALFFGSTPIYEDDWNRYLWDGASVRKGINPYVHSPQDAIDGVAGPDIEALRTDPDNTVLHRVNNKDLTTVYPPVAQAVFAAAALIKPFSLDALRLVYLISEALTFLLILKALSLYGRSSLWFSLYALNPLIIVTGFNAVHMDVILAPAIIGALIAIRRHPILAALCLSAAAAIKLWPLLLAPVLFRKWRGVPHIYFGSALLIALLTLIGFLPLLRELGATSGLLSYSQNWQRSSFLFPLLQKALSLVVNDPAQIARMSVAILLIGFSLWRGLKTKHISDDRLPTELLALTLGLLFLSPTGFPWYVMWALVFISFRPLYGVALLASLVPLYYLRFALGEQDLYHLYTGVLVPLQFGLPLLVLGVETWRGRVHG